MPCLMPNIGQGFDGGVVGAYCLARVADDLQALALFRLGEQRLVDVMLEAE